KAMTLRDSVDRIHVGWNTVDVHREDGLRSRRDTRCDVGWVDVECAWIDVGEDRDRRLMEHCDRSRNERERAGNDLVTGPDAGRARRHVDCSCSAIARQGV